LNSPIPNSAARNTRTFGILKMTLHPSSYDWQFVPETGGTFTDSGTASCVKVPQNLTPPTIVGIAQQGQTLTGDRGTWSADPPVTYAYQWQRCGFAGQIQADLPQAWWRLDESSGATAADASGNGNSAGIQGGMSLGQPGAPGFAPNTAAFFDGATGWVSAPSMGIASGPFTLETWAFINGPGSTGATAFDTLFGTTGSFTRRILWRASDGKLLAQFNGNFTSSLSVSPNTWHLIDYVFDGAQERFYIDGLPAGSHATSAPSWPSTFRLGANGDGANYFLQGTLDEPAVYRSALSPARIAGHASGCSDIPGATGTSYALGSQEIGSRLRLAVTATNAGGQTTALSSLTAQVTT
jgi:hypothetical protein